MLKYDNLIIILPKSLSINSKSKIKNLLLETNYCDMENDESNNTTMFLYESSYKTINELANLANKYFDLYGEFLHIY